MTAVENDKVLIGMATGAFPGASHPGAAYLYRTNGILFGPALENPDVTQNDIFGLPLAAVGTDTLLVGSFNQGRQPVPSIVKRAQT